MRFMVRVAQLNLTKLIDFAKCGSKQSSQEVEVIY